MRCCFPRHSALQTSHQNQRGLKDCGRLNIAPHKDVHFLILETCVFVTLHGKGNFADAIKLSILRREDYPGSCRQVQCNHKGPSKRKPNHQNHRRKCDGRSRGQSEVGPQANTRQPLKAGKGKETDSYRELLENWSLVLIFDPFWILSVQNYNTINLCCFKPLTLW